MFFRKSSKIKELERKISILENALDDKDKIIKMKDRELEVNNKIIEKLKLNYSYNAFKYGHDLIESMVHQEIADSYKMSLAPTDKDINRLIRENKDLKFKLDTNKKRLNSMMKYIPADNKFDIIESISSDIDKFIDKESKTLDNKLMLNGNEFNVLGDDQYLFTNRKYKKAIADLFTGALGEQIVQISEMQSESLKIEVENMTKRNDESFMKFTELDILDIVEDIKGDFSEGKVRDILPFIVSSNLKKFGMIARDYMLCNLFRSFVKRSIKLNYNAKMLLESIKDRLIAINQAVDDEITNLKIENRKLRDTISQFTLDDKDKRIKELEKEIAGLRVENETLRYKRRE